MLFRDVLLYKSIVRDEIPIVLAQLILTTIPY